MALKRPLVLASGRIQQLQAADTLDGAVAISAPGGAVSAGTVVFANSNGVSFGMNGSTLTASVGAAAGPTVRYWRGPLDPITPNAIAPNSAAINLSFQRVVFPLQLSATRMDLLAHLTVAGSTANSYTISAAVYTMSGSTMAMASSGSVGVTFNSGTNLTAASIYGAHSGTRWRSVPVAWNLTPGEYVIGMMISQLGPAGTTGSMTVFGGSSVSIVGEIAGGNHVPYFGDGQYSVATGAFPASVHLTGINQTGASALRQPYVALAGTF